MWTLFEMVKEMVRIQGYMCSVGHYIRELAKTYIFQQVQQMNIYYMFYCFVSSGMCNLCL